jgi:hypothetical protein
MLTDRALHDAFEEPVLASIRAGRGSTNGGVESSSAGGECQPCIEEYRNLLNKRQVRAEHPAEGSGGGRLPLVGRWLGKRFVAAAMRAF